MFAERGWSVRKAWYKKSDITMKSRIARQMTLRRKKHTLAVLLEIKDNGPGVPDSIQDQIFYPLVSSHSNGHGIGLTLAQEIVHAHGGLIDFNSEKVQPVSVFISP